jgi:hypothetical protein
MRLRFAEMVFVALGVVASVAAQATPGHDPGPCPNDSKLIGQVSVLGTGLEGTWWGLIYNGMVDYGFVTPEQQRDYLNGVYGTDFDTLEEVRDFNLQDVSNFFDNNQNGFVCAYELRGTRAYNDDPLFEYTWFGVSDDKIRN